jgi:integrase/recombinase XerD
VEPGAAPLLGPTWFVALGRDWFRSLSRKRRAPATIASYTTSLRNLGRWLEHEGVAAPNALSREHLQSWQDSLISRVGPKSQAVFAAAVRGLLRWAAREGRVPPGLADWVEVVEVPDREPLVLEPEQLQAIVTWYQRPRPRGDLEWYRDRALFWFLLTSSARISEVLRLDLADVDRTRWVVVQKGGGQKTLVISALARQWLQQYIVARGRDQEPALWIYVGPVTGRRRLRGTDVNAIWRRLSHQVGIPTFTSRYLRGTGATELNELDATAVDVAHHLGHHGIATVLRYAKLRDRRRQALIDRLDALVPEAPAVPPPTPRRRARKARSKGA